MQYPILKLKKKRKLANLWHFFSEEIRNEITAGINIQANNKTILACRCLPACDSTSYDAEVLKSEFDYKTYRQSLYNYLNYDVK